MSLDLGLAARVVAGIRTHTAQRTGCPEWDPAGVASALRSTEGSPGSVLAAAALAAEDPSLAKPSERAFATHWPKNATSGPRVSRNVPCVDHADHDMPCQHPDHRGDMTPEQISAAAETIRAQLRAAPKYVPPAVKRAQALEAQ